MPFINAFRGEFGKIMDDHHGASHTVELAHGGSHPSSSGHASTGGGYPTSGTWESPKGSLLTQVEKVDRGLLARMYQAEANGGNGLSELSRQADAKTNNAYNLGYMNPRVPNRSANTMSSMPAPARRG